MWDRQAQVLNPQAGSGSCVPANFFVFYEVDEDESKHSLLLEEYGQQEQPNAWVLLEAVV